MKNEIVTEKRVSALVILKKEQMGLPRFTKLMWGREVAIKFARHFLAGLVKLGYVERKLSGKEELYAVTGEGEEAVLRARCGYCQAQKGKVKLAQVLCRGCGKEHWTCSKCSSRTVVVVGDFPKYRPALKECPR